MKTRQLIPLLPLTALALAVTACQPEEDAEDRGDATSYAVLAEDASLAWSVQLESDWSPTHAVSVGDTVIVSTGWEIDEGTAITAYRPDGSVAWTDSGYGGALLAPVGDDQVLICDSEESWTVAVEDGSVVDEGAADDERCPVADDEEGIPVPRNDEAYTLDGATLTVETADGSYDVALDQPVDEIWGVDGGVVAFVDETDTVQLYR